METKKWSTKRKVLVSILVILCAAIIAGVLYMFFKPDPLPQVSAAKVTRGSITQTLDMSGKVSSSQKGNFIPIDGTKVLTVNVKVGEYVKKGDVLATFDTSSLNSVLADKQQAYLTAVENYKNAKNIAVTSSAQLKEINARLAEIDKELEKQEKEQNKNNGSDKNNQNKTDSEASNKFWELISKALGMEDINAALKKLDELLNSGNSNLFGSGVSALQMEKMQLELKKVTLEAQSGVITQSTYKTIMEATKKELDSLTASLASLKKGWIAEYDGIVSEVNITPGETCRSAATANIDISSIIDLASGNTNVSDIVNALLGQTQSGITVEYYPFVVDFVLGKADIFKVSLDMPCRVTAADDTVVDGVVTYISPVATQSSGVNISSLIGSGSANGVDAKVTIEKPTSSVIIGLDVDVSIDVDSKDNVLIVPSEAVKNDSNGTYVYIYNSKTKRIKSSKVELGLSDDTRYEIVSGCEEGDTVITTVPTGTTLADGDKVKIVASK
jgi:HlyD family secretion protein